jgi:serine/threonine protein phosphatase PrpC
MKAVQEALDHRGNPNLVPDKAFGVNKIAVYIAAFVALVLVIRVAFGPVLAIRTAIVTVGVAIIEVVVKWVLLPNHTSQSRVLELFNITSPTNEARADVSSTDISVLGSQGLTSTVDRSIAWIHATTVPAEYYEASYNIKGGCNMDRGGCGQTQAGYNFACVFDGVSAGGKINAYAAQAFSEITLSNLGSCGVWAIDTDPLTSLHNTSKEIFAQATAQQSNPGLINAEYDADGGSATGVFAFIRPRSLTSGRSAGTSEVCGVAIGDAMAIRITTRSSDSGHQPRLHQPEAFVLNTFERRGHDATDTGGQLTMGVGINGEVSPFCEGMGEEDVIVLASDGLGDNIVTAELTEIIPFIVRMPFFEQYGRLVAGGAAHHPGCKGVEKGAKSWRTHSPPTMADLTTHFGGQDQDSGDDATDPTDPTDPTALSSITCEQVSLRLVGYLRWVTEPMRQDQALYYSLEARRRPLVTNTCPVVLQCLRSSCFPPSPLHCFNYLRGVSLTHLIRLHSIQLQEMHGPATGGKAKQELVQELELLDTQLRDLMQARKRRKKERTLQQCKTDDCMVVAMRAPPPGLGAPGPHRA